MDRDALKEAAVIGAGGKMGQGIALLLLQQMAIECPDCTLRLIDTHEAALKKTMSYLKTEMTRFAERSINPLRKHYAEREDLVSNEEIIRAFVDDALLKVQWGSALSGAKKSPLIFEAIIEDRRAKIDLFVELEKESLVKPWYFTNTSSLPVALLANAANIKGRLIGFHFYNPPAVQRLIELIVPEGVDPMLVAFSKELAALMKKEIVFSEDKAGFIGNGHFLRELSYAAERVHTAEEIVRLNSITEKLLLRPMGIFCLADYVGLDVVRNIAKTMREALSIELPLGFIEEVPSIFRNHCSEVFDPASKKYLKVNPSWQEVGAHIPWKEVKPDQIKPFLESLSNSEATKFLAASKNIADGLVKEGVARSSDDVNRVLKLGFYHLYGAGGI